MKISELINVLQQNLNTHGDHDIIVNCQEGPEHITSITPKLGYEDVFLWYSIDFECNCP